MYRTSDGEPAVIFDDFGVDMMDEDDWENAPPADDREQWPEPQEPEDEPPTPHATQG